jgi:hypothetical protein
VNIKEPFFTFFNSRVYSYFPILTLMFHSSTGDECVCIGI